MNKSNLMGIFVDSNKVKDAVAKIVVKALHGEDGKIGKKVQPRYPSTWLNIINEIDSLKLHGIDLVSFITPKLGNWTNTSFWDVAWCGDIAFKNLVPRLRNPRGGVEQAQFERLKEMVEGVNLSNSNDRWSWSLVGSGDFSVSSVRKLIDNAILPNGISKTRWIKEVRIKINVHAWKVIHDCLPTRFNISRRGIEIESILYHMCECSVESSRHLFFSCKMISDVMRRSPAGGIWSTGRSIHLNIGVNGSHPSGSR
nr:hypothetical protein [Tanacetum cinerariifolium]